MNDPDVRYRATSDGVDIAYWVVGEGPPLIHLPGIPYTHIGHEWRIPEFRRWFELLADRRAMVRYDSRGLGLSQREVSTCSLEAFVLDLDAVIGAVSAAKVALYARVHATPIALAYAARHPERVSHVVLMRGYARGRDHVRSEAASQVREHLGSNWDRFTRELAMYGPRWTGKRATAQFTRYVSDGITPELFALYDRAIHEADVSSELERIAAPTLLLYRESRPSDLPNANELAARIANATVKMLPDSADSRFLGDADDLASTIGAFLANAVEAEAKLPT